MCRLPGALGPAFPAAQSAAGAMLALPAGALLTGRAAGEWAALRSA